MHTVVVRILLFLQAVVLYLGLHYLAHLQSVCNTTQSNADAFCSQWKDGLERKLFQKGWLRSL